MLCERTDSFRARACARALDASVRGIAGGCDAQGFELTMGLWPTHRDESALLRLIDSKRVTPRLSTKCYGLVTSNNQSPSYRNCANGQTSMLLIYSS